MEREHKELREERGKKQKKEIHKKPIRRRKLDGAFTS